MRPQLQAHELLENLEELERSRLAHVAAIKLAEGEVFEIAFMPEDCEEFIGTHLKDPIFADKLLIEDVMGSLHPVRDSEQHLKEMTAVWTPPELAIRWVEERLTATEVNARNESQRSKRE